MLQAPFPHALELQTSGEMIETKQANQRRQRLRSIASIYDRWMSSKEPPGDPEPPVKEPDPKDKPEGDPPRDPDEDPDRRLPNKREDPEEPQFSFETLGTTSNPTQGLRLL
jgi:hypothetical protein